MSTFAIAAATFIAATLLALLVISLLYEGLFSYRNTVQDRIDELMSGSENKEHAVSLFKDIKLLPMTDVLRRSTLKERVQQLSDQAGLQIGLTNFFLLSLLAAIVTASVAALASWWLAAALAPLAGAAPLVAMLLRRHHRRHQLCRQLPEAFEMISRAVRAGQTVPAALQIIADDFDKPISAEFALCYEQQNLGMSRESALRRLAARSGVMELQIFVVALLVQARSGGDLIELLDNLALMIRKRLKLKDRVRALTGEGRIQALVLTVLPIAAFAGILSLAPDYASVLLDRPWLLGGTLVAQAAGAMWIRQIVNFDY